MFQMLFKVQTLTISVDVFLLSCVGSSDQVVDWDKGLPLDVLALVARTWKLDPNMKGMQSVSKTWQQGFDYGVSQIAICYEIDPEKSPFRADSAQRFPGLTTLNLGPSEPAPEARERIDAILVNLRGFKKLHTLVLGLEKEETLECIRSSVSDSWIQHLEGMQHADLNLARCSRLQGNLEALHGMPLTCLNLTHCTGLSDACMESLRGAPLKYLYLGHCAWLSDTGMAALSGLPLVILKMEGCPLVTPEGLRGFAGMPLAFLNLQECLGVLNDAGLERLRGLPLIDLVAYSFTSPSFFTDAGMAVLEHMPLTRLNLMACQLVTDAGFQYLRKMPLTRLHVSNCSITTAGLEYLGGKPLTYLDVMGCENLDEASLGVLEGMSLATLHLPRLPWLTGSGLARLRGHTNLDRLCLAECTNITDDGLVHLGGLSNLKHLNLAECTALTDAGLVHLAGLLLRDLSLGGCALLTDAGMVHLQSIPLQDLVLRGCVLLTSAGVGNLGMATTLKKLDFRDCPLITDDVLGILRNMPRGMKAIMEGSGMSDRGKKFAVCLLARPHRNQF